MNSNKQVKESKSLRIFYVDDFLHGNVQNDIQLPKQVPQIGMDKINAKTSWGKYFVDFCSSSTIHGFNHMTAPRRHIFERILTVAFIVGAFICLIFLSINMWNRFQNNPTVITLDHEYRKFKVTRPAVIVCPTPAIDELKFPEVFEKYNIKDTNETRDFFSFLSDANYSSFDSTPEFDLVDPEKWILILNDLKPDIESKILPNPRTGYWIITERGFCLAFNNYAHPYSSLEYWQENNWTRIPKPDVVDAYNFASQEIFDGLDIKKTAVKFGIIYPKDVIDYNTEMFMAAHIHLTKLEYLAVEVGYTEEVSTLSVKQRKCKNTYENNLKMWPIYTFVMCIRECRLQRIINICKCLPHFARPMQGIPVCDAAQLRCIAANFNKITLSDYEIRYECECYPDCHTAIYYVESYKTTGFKETIETVINIKILFPFDKFQRTLLFGFNDFLASVGGAAGLFLGASVISFVEIFYFATLRLFWYKRHLNKKKMKKSKKVTFKKKKNFYYSPRY